MIVIAEPYFRFSSTTADELLELRAAEIIEASEPIARGVYAEINPPSLNLSVRLEIGSTRIWITVSAAASLLVGYGGFRQAVDYLAHDGRWLADKLVPVVAPMIGDATPAYRRRRLGVVGKLERLFAQVEMHEMS